VRNPKWLIGVEPLTIGCRDRSLVEGPRIMRKRCGEIHRAQENVEIVEVRRPRGPGDHSPPFLLDHHRKRRELLLTGLLECKEQPHLKSEGLGNLPRVDSLWPAFDYFDTGTGEFVHRIGKHSAGFSGDR
jgi:hypothetical protein